MKTSKPKIGIAVLVLVAVAVFQLSGCGTPAPTAAPTEPAAATPVPTEPGEVETPPPSGPVMGGELKVVLQSDITGVDPHLRDTYFQRVVQEMVYEGLVSRNYDMEIVPRLAESWEIPDNQTYVFHLREGVKFHNGRELVADDVVYSLDRVRDPETSVFASWLTAIEEVVAVDDYTVELHLSRPDAPLLDTLARGDCVMVPREVVEEDGGIMSGEMVGTGPFRWVEWIPKQHVKLERNPDYWQQGLPYLDRITFIPIEDEVARTTALRTGTVDFVDAIYGQHAQLLKEEEGVVLAGRPDTGWYYVGMNCTQPPFDDVRVRQAVAWAIDRQAYVDTVMVGEGVVCDGGPIPEGNWGYADLHIFTEPDLEKARALLAEAGYADGFETNIVAGAGFPLEVGMAEVTQEALEPLGITVDVRPIEFGVLMEQVFANRDFEMQANAWGPLWDPDQFLYPEFHSDGEWNPQGYSNAEVDQLLEQGREELDQEKRAEIYRRAQEIIVEEAPTVLFAHSLWYQGWRDYVKGFHPMADGANISWIETWLDK